MGGVPVNGDCISGLAIGGDVTLATGVSERTPFGTIGKTGIAPGIGTESFLLLGGSNSGGRHDGMACFSRALYTRCIA